MVIFKKHEKSNRKNRKRGLNMKTRYFKNNQEYFNFINKYKDELKKCIVVIKAVKIKVQYEVWYDKRRNIQNNDRIRFEKRNIKTKIRRQNNTKITK